MKTSPNLTIILPTFNEERNVDLIIGALRKAFSKESHSYEILFVDDSSDNTPDKIRAHMRKDSSIRMIHRPKEERTGLATAFVKGFEEARSDHICCIDSDMQHPPELVPALFKKLLLTESDVAVASRYIPGGSAEGLGGFYRKFASLVCKYVAQIILTPARLTSDPGSGFFIFKKSVIEKTKLSPQGFKILLEILVRGSCNKVVDLAYTFRTRENDLSKATLQQGIRYFKHLFNLFYTVPKASRFIRFAIVGGIGAVINLATLYLLTESNLVGIRLAWLIAVLISIGTNFALNNIFTFPETKARSRKGYTQKYISYALLSFLTLVVNYAFFTVTLKAGAHYLVSAICGIAGALLLNFTVSKKIIWAQGSLEHIIQTLKVKFSIKYIPAYILALGIAYVSIRLFIHLTPVVALMVLSAAILSIQGFFSLFLMIYSWEDPEKIANFRSPEKYSAPKRSFTALIPARHEKDVIAYTIRAVHNIHYPDTLKEILIICRTDDLETIQVSEQEIRSIGNPKIKLVLFDGFPINKPHGLNIGLKEASGDVVTIFDAEDEPHRDIYNIINTVMIKSGADVVQSGVQLMNHRSNWFSLFNVLEYYFWFKSSLHFFSRMGIIPLGGNTVFFKKEWLEKVEGWDEHCLTEDADIGFRLSIAGANIRVVYDERHVTQEETPPNTMSFIKQRTRWNQGFIQILLKGDWLKLPTFKQRLLAFYTLAWPLMQGLLFLYFPISLFIALTVKMPPLVAIIANFPLYLLGLFLIVYNIGLWEFTRDYKKNYSPWLPIKSFLVFYPFQFILGLGAFRSVWRSLRKNRAWEKTAHTNAHRTSTPQPAV